METQVKNTAGLCTSCQRCFLYSNCKIVMEACETSLDGYNRSADILKNRLDTKEKENKPCAVTCENTFPEAWGFLKWSAETTPINKGENNNFACIQRTALAHARAKCSHTPLHSPVAQQLHHWKRKTSFRSSNSHPFVKPQQNKTGIDTDLALCRKFLRLFIFSTQQNFSHWRKKEERNKKPPLEILM